MTLNSLSYRGTGILPVILYQFQKRRLHTNLRVSASPRLVCQSSVAISTQIGITSGHLARHIASG